MTLLIFLQSLIRCNLTCGLRACWSFSSCLPLKAEFTGELTENHSWTQIRIKLQDHVLLRLHAIIRPADCMLPPALSSTIYAVEHTTRQVSRDNRQPEKEIIQSSPYKILHILESWCLYVECTRYIESATVTIRIPVKINFHKCNEDTCGSSRTSKHNECKDRVPAAMFVSDRAEILQRPWR